MTNMIGIEVPRLVKKPGGVYKRVETHDELTAALAEGWLLRLPAHDPEPAEVSESVEPDVVSVDDAAVESDAEPAHRKPGRPLGSGKKK